uniref:(northern house mosquito) hypothetical protein n=2 Tax=Culex pipiens TaxID=7175 RepID=A0A8D8C1I4_CULPI
MALASTSSDGGRWPTLPSFAPSGGRDSSFNTPFPAPHSPGFCSSSSCCLRILANSANSCSMCRGTGFRPAIGVPGVLLGALAPLSPSLSAPGMVNLRRRSLTLRRNSSPRSGSSWSGWVGGGGSGIGGFGGSVLVILTTLCRRRASRSSILACHSSYMRSLEDEDLATVPVDAGLGGGAGAAATAGGFWRGRAAGGGGRSTAKSFCLDT